MGERVELKTLAQERKAWRDHFEAHWPKTHDAMSAPNSFVLSLIQDMDEVFAALDAETARADAAVAEVARLREALTDIGVYGCGMLNQPIAINGPEEAWLRKRIAEYERRACAALSPKEGGGG